MFAVAGKSDADAFEVHFDVVVAEYDSEDVGSVMTDSVMTDSVMTYSDLCVVDDSAASVVECGDNAVGADSANVVAPVMLRWMIFVVVGRPSTWW